MSCGQPRQWSMWASSSRCSLVEYWVLQLGHSRKLSSSWLGGRDGEITVSLGSLEGEGLPWAATLYGLDSHCSLWEGQRTMDHTVWFQLLCQLLKIGCAIIRRYTRVLAYLPHCCYCTVSLYKVYYWLLCILPKPTSDSSWAAWSFVLRSSFNTLCSCFCKYWQSFFSSSKSLADTWICNGENVSWPQLRKGTPRGQIQSVVWMKAWYPA